MVNVLILGSKEFPLGINNNFDKFSSGGMEVHAEELVNTLKKKHNIMVITRKFPSTKKFEKFRNVTVFRVPWVKGFFFRNPSFNFMSFLKALKLNFDVIICQDVIASFFGLILSKIKRKPFISVMLGTPSEQPQYNFLVKTGFKLVEGLIYSGADHVLSVKNKKYGAPSTFIGLGFDKSWFNLKKKKLGKNKILFAGRLIKVKSVDTLIKACVGLKNYELVILGDGPERVFLESLAKSLGVNAKFLGVYKPEQYKKHLADSSVYVLPSVSEGFPYSLLEAMSSKTRVVVSDIGLLDNSMAWVFKPESISGLEECIVSALSDKKSGKVSKAFKFLDEFSWESVSKKYNQVIQKVVEK
ncbi:MAG: glycosyltransferase family 4 protein [Nanoarchaeota archaeon]|nr:glycosyltransferase family 4 protein [Nanoarchaeota archaeon]